MLSKDKETLMLHNLYTNMHVTAWMLDAVRDWQKLASIYIVKKGHII